MSTHHTGRQTQTQTHKHTHTHVRLLSLPQSKALLLHIKSMLSHSCEVDGRAFPRKNHFLCTLESHIEQSTSPESQDDLGNGYGKNGKRTTGQIPPQPRLLTPGSGIWLPGVAPPTSPFRSHKHPLCPQLPSVLPGATARDCPSRHTRPNRETTYQLARNHSSTFLDYLKSCPRPFMGSS